jgi:hypothetical protein
MPQHGDCGHARSVEVFREVTLRSYTLELGMRWIPPVLPMDRLQRFGDPSKRAAPRGATDSTVCLGSFRVHSEAKHMRRTNCISNLQTERSLSTGS